MSLLLVVNVIHDPRQIPGPERYHSVTKLPLQRFTELVRACSLHLADPRIDLKWRKERCREVNVILYTADGVEVRLVIIYDPILYEPIQFGLELSCDEREIIFCMPRKMQIYL